MSFGEILDRAITIFVRTLKDTLPVSIVVFFVPIFLIRVLISDVFHVQWVEKHGFGYIDNIIGSISGTVMISIYSAKMDGREFKTKELIEIIKRYGIACVLLAFFFIASLFIALVPIAIPLGIWHTSNAHHYGLGGVLATALFSPLAVVGIVLFAGSLFFYQLALTCLVEGPANPLVAMSTAKRRFLARGTRKHTLAIVVSSAVIYLLGVGLDDLVKRIVSISSNVLLPIDFWPFSMYLLAIAVVYNRDARNRYEGLDIERKLSLIGLERA